ncbi:SsgA family sporulation/cell division regulator [Streptomyces sp. NPDC048473]|uniref:SsgA family sporulation/cell division regulator n=1 Tax=unclassified Streptomyces TaxID=2593676 RepID=UPI00370FC196
MNTAISCDLLLRIVLSDDSSLPIPAGLRYDTADPYAVRVTFYTFDEMVEWVFARDLLAQGLYQPAGIGDVRMWPSSRLGESNVCLALRSGEEEALFEASARPLELFVKRMDAAVPPGTEHRHVDLETELSHLLLGN